MIMVMATSVMGVTKMGNIVPRVWLEPRSLVFWASVLSLHHICSLTSLVYPRPPVYAVPCLRTATYIRVLCVNICEELFFQNKISTYLKKNSLQCQGQVHRSCFGKEPFIYMCIYIDKELFVYVYIYIYINIYIYISTFIWRGIFEKNDLRT